jgi:protein-disulfide isomerase
LLDRLKLDVARMPKAAALALALCLVILAAGSTTRAAAEDKVVAMEELMKSGSELPDLSLGSPDAKAVAVEYASLTCGHCRHFAVDVFPEVKKKYIDTGKLRFIYRDFPLDPRAFGGSMLARCLGTDKAFALTETLFHEQEKWAHVKENPKQALFELVKQAGFTEESFDKCLTDQKLFEQLTAVQKRASDVFGVNATPSIFVDGKKLSAPTLEAFDQALAGK